MKFFVVSDIIEFFVEGNGLRGTIAGKKGQRFVLRQSDLISQRLGLRNFNFVENRQTICLFLSLFR